MIPQSVNTKLRYDDNLYTYNVARSAAPGDYVLGAPVPRCDPCFPNDARRQPGTSPSSVCANIVDVESELQNLTRRATLSPDGKYHPTEACKATAAPLCRPNMATEDTRLSNPPCTLRGTGWNRWEWLCRNPQDNALLPFDTSVNTSLVAKDNHRPHLPKPVDQTMALPPLADTPAGYGNPDWIPRGCDGKPVPDKDILPNVHWKRCSEINA